VIAVIFELTPAEGRFADYPRLVERFESISRPGHFVSLAWSSAARRPATP
jgi:hypothetical protein